MQYNASTNTVTLVTGSTVVWGSNVVWGDTVGVTWHANMSSYCTAGTGAALHVYVNDIDQGPAGGVGPNGSLTVVPFQTTSVMLVLFSGGSKTLGSASVSVTAYDPPPLERGTKITLLDNDPVWRRLFVRWHRRPTSRSRRSQT